MKPKFECEKLHECDCEQARKEEREALLGKLKVEITEAAKKSKMYDVPAFYMKVKEIIVQLENEIK